MTTYAREQDLKCPLRCVFLKLNLSFSLALILLSDFCKRARWLSGLYHFIVLFQSQFLKFRESNGHYLLDQTFHCDYLLWTIWT